MEIVIDVPRNRFCVNQQWVEGRRRWEAAAFADLVTASGMGAQASVSAGALGKALAARGQAAPFDRTQWRRLWASVEGIFLKCGHSDDFHRRFLHAPRAKTTGPWAWCRDPSDRISIMEDDRRNSKVSSIKLHRIAKDGSVLKSLSIARRLSVAHALWSGGPRAEAIGAFLDGEEWDYASPEVLTHRALCLADAYAMCSQMDKAGEHLKTALRLIENHNTCTDQSTYADLIEVGIKSFSQGTNSDARYNDELLRRLAHRSNYGCELDARTRCWAYSYIAGAYVQEIEDSAAVSKPTRAQVKRVLDYHHAAIFMGIAAGAYDVLITGIEYLFRSLVKLVLATKASTISECLECYLCAQSWRQMLDPPDGLSVIDTWLGALCVARPETYSLISRLVEQRQWLGPRPDNMEFFQASLARAKSIGDPIVVAMRALNYYSYSKMANGSAEILEARAILLAVCRDYPVVKDRLMAAHAFDRVPELTSSL